MALINLSTVVGTVMYNIAFHIFGSELLAGLYLLTLLLGVAGFFRLGFIVGSLLLIPVSIVLAAYSYITPLAAGIHIIVVCVVVAVNFFTTR